MDNSYKLKNYKDGSPLNYFVDHPISEWSFEEFEASFNKDSSTPTSTTKIKNTYLLNLKNIQDLKDVPDFVKDEVRRLSASLESPETKQKNISYNITANNSFVNTLGSISINSKRNYKSDDDNSETSKLQETEGGSDPTSNLVNPYEKEEEEEEEEEEDKTPSDLSIDHHPHRTCDYSLLFANSDEEEGANTDDFEITSDESKWVVDNTSISDFCFDFKNVSLILSKHGDPAQLSDIRLLALNDIYKFDKNFTSSISKYFTARIHTFLKSTLSFDAYLPINGLDFYGCCREIEMSPPVDWLSSVTLCAELLTKACASKNLLDIHTAHVLTQILPVLFNGPPDDSNEDTYVHYYLSPLLTSVFGSDPLLKMKWANGQLSKNNHSEFKPDFLVYNFSGSVKCNILIAEFKPTEQNLYVESDLVKLAKQMKVTLNALVARGATKPKVCGVHCEGENVETYVMDIPSPRLYRLTSASKIKLFKNLDQISLLPNVITHLLCLKGVAVETATKIETAALYSLNNLKRQASDPPMNWLSNSSFVLSRIPKKQKK